MIFFLCGHFFNLCINGVIISRRFHITDHTYATGKSGPSINASFDCKVLSIQ